MSRARARMRVSSAIVVAACALALLSTSAPAQEVTVRIDGRVLWIAGGTMLVAPFGGDAVPVRVDLSQADQSEYMRLTSGDAVTVIGTIAPGGNGVVAATIGGWS